MSGEIRVSIDQAEVESFRRVATRTGRPMVSFRITAGKEKLACVAFNRTAEDADLAEGDLVSLAGRLQSTSWTTAEGDKRWGVQVVVDHITPIGETQTPAPAPPPPRPAPSARQKPAQQRRMFDPAAPGPNDYQGGPF